MPCNMTRRTRLLASLAAILMAGGVAAGLVLAFGNSSSQAAPTQAEYFARVAKICGVYGPKLDQITPPQDVTIPGEVVTALTRVIPLIEAETKAVRALRLPDKIAGKIRDWLKLKDRTLAALKETLREAKAPSIAGTAAAYIQFEKLARETSKAGHEIGFPSICSSAS
jgi:hypothetical protein